MVPHVLFNLLLVVRVFGGVLESEPGLKAGGRRRTESPTLAFRAMIRHADGWLGREPQLAFPVIGADSFQPRYPNVLDARQKPAAERLQPPAPTRGEEGLPRRGGASARKSTTAGATDSHSVVGSSRAPSSTPAEAPVAGASRHAPCASSSAKPTGPAQGLLKAPESLSQVSSKRGHVLEQALLKIGTSRSKGRQGLPRSTPSSPPVLPLGSRAKHFDEDAREMALSDLVAYWTFKYLVEGVNLDDALDKARDGVRWLEEESKTRASIAGFCSLRPKHRRPQPKRTTTQRVSSSSVAVRAQVTTVSLEIEESNIGSATLRPTSQQPIPDPIDSLARPTICFKPMSDVVKATVGSTVSEKTCRFVDNCTVFQ